MRKASRLVGDRFYHSPMATVRAYAAESAGAPLKKFEYESKPLGFGEVELKVESCGICHSDLSMIGNDWGNAVFPLVAGHEVIGRVVELGPGATRFRKGDRVGLGWFAKSCRTCRPCLGGDLNLCGTAEQTIVGRHGGFADRVTAHEMWLQPLPAGLDALKSGPLFCGGITVFSPIVVCGVQPSDRVAVIGIGGLGHLAVQFLHHWGCEVTAFTSTPGKAEELKRLGAHQVVSLKNEAELDKMAGSFDFILVTVNVSLDWPRLVQLLAPKGRLHLVGAVLEPLSLPVFPLLMGQKAVSGSPLGNPAVTAEMLNFCVRHNIAPLVEPYPMSRVNDALAHLKSGQARYRIVLQNDFS